MRISEVVDRVVDEEPASRALCTSGKPDSALGASQLSSCKSQGYRSRDGGKSHKIGGERQRSVARRSRARSTVARYLIGVKGCCQLMTKSCPGTP